MTEGAFSEFVSSWPALFEEEEIPAIPVVAEGVESSKEEELDPSIPEVAVQPHTDSVDGSRRHVFQESAVYSARQLNDLLNDPRARRWGAIVDSP